MGDSGNGRTERKNMGKMAIPIVWAICLSVAFVIVKVLRIGPVILVVSERMGWGVHTGDFLAIPVILVAVVATVLLK